MDKKGDLTGEIKFMLTGETMTTLAADKAADEDKNAKESVSSTPPVPTGVSAA